MLKEALDALVALAHRADAVQIVTPDAEPDHVYWMRDTSGMMERHAAEPRPRLHLFSSLASLVHFAKMSEATDDSGSQENNVYCPSLWYNRNGVVYILHDDERRDVAQVNMGFSVPFNHLQVMQAGVPTHKHVELVRLLRVTFADCTGPCPNLLTQLKGVRWEKNESGESVIGQGKASLGKKIEAKLTGYGEIPETIELDVPLWEGYPWRANVRCDLEVLADTQSFTLRPLPGECAKAIRDGEEKVRATLAQYVEQEGLELPIYYGTP